MQTLTLRLTRKASSKPSQSPLAKACEKRSCWLCWLLLLLMWYTWRTQNFIAAISWSETSLLSRVCAAKAPKRRSALDVARAHSWYGNAGCATITSDASSQSLWSGCTVKLSSLIGSFILPAAQKVSILDNSFARMLNHIVWSCTFT